MNKNLIKAAIATLVALLAVFVTKSPLAPLPLSNDTLHLTKVIPVTGAFGPESLVFDPNGEGPYTGVADGRVLKLQEKNGVYQWTGFASTTSNRSECIRPFAPELEHVCGRPLGLRFEKKTRQLYIADAYFGLQVVGPDGGLATPLVSQVEGQHLRFTNDLDIDEEDDVIYFTDSSKVYYRRQFMAASFLKDTTGRLLKYDKSTKKVTILLEGLSFPNGVALSKDRSFLLIAESTNFRILRLWLHGPNRGKLDIFAKLPGFPDNIRSNSNGEIWVALNSKTGLFGKVVFSHSWFGKTLLKLPISIQQLDSMITGGKPHATAIKLSEDGKVVQVLEDCAGKTLKLLSEVEEKDGKLWFGSLMMPFIGVYNLE